MVAQQSHYQGERRQHQRVRVSIPSRFMLEDHSEHDGMVTEMSPATATISSPSKPGQGERVVAYLHHVGRVQGTVSRAWDSGFALDLNTPPRKREKLAAQLTWLANRSELDLPEDRRHDRLQPRNPGAVLTLSDGRQYRCRIIDLSLSGAALGLAVRPALKSQVTLGNMRGQVVRHFDEGIAIEFAHVQNRAALADFLDS
ncbi:MAG: PilZ domain-containing protein [Pseudomonadota bacterium]